MLEHTNSTTNECAYLLLPIVWDMPSLLVMEQVYVTDYSSFIGGQTHVKL